VKIVFHQAADEEFGKAANWYGSRREGLDDDFELDVLTALDVIADSPQAFRTWPDIPEVRVFTMDRFPFLIVYTQPEREMMLVLAVAHASRRPAYWAERLAR
jgi:plasmid stabilization system protein ParE